MNATVQIRPRTSSRKAIEASFVASDGQVIFYRYWKPELDSRSAILMFHRGHEHSGRWQEFVDTSELDRCWFFAWDARGHGRTEGVRGAAESFSRMVRDADEFARHIEAEFGIDLCDMGVVGQSVGAVVAAAWVHDYARPIRAMVLATPALKIKLYVPFAIPGLRGLQAIRPQSFIKSYVRPSMLTRDQQQARAYANDPLISPQIAVNILLDLHDTAQRLVADAATIHTPTLMIVSGRDYVVDQEIQRRFFDRLSATDKQLEVLPEALHSTFWDADRAAVIKQSANFLKTRFETASEPPDSDTLAASTTQTYQAIQQSPSVGKQVYFGIQKMLLATAGRLSRGVRIGLASGFDSGQSLDHVYRNRSEGTSSIGRAIDGSYLNAVGWRGIRQRKVHLEEILDRAIADAVREFGRVQLLDVASGPGRYVLDTIKRNESLPITAVLCDRDPVGLAEGRGLAKAMGLEDRVEYRFSDAFDPDAIARATEGKRVQIAIVSGLYELFPENASVKRSLAGLANVVATGGWLVYTDQPWHPQQEMIARVLPNRDGKPWVMRCRSQAEMNALVAEAGFEHDDLRVDRWGIFSVASARKR